MPNSQAFRIPFILASQPASENVRKQHARRSTESRLEKDVFVFAVYVSIKPELCPRLLTSHGKDLDSFARPTDTALVIMTDFQAIFQWIPPKKYRAKIFSWPQGENGRRKEGAALLLDTTYDRYSRACMHVELACFHHPPSP